MQVRGHSSEWPLLLGRAQVTNGVTNLASRQSLTQRRPWGFPCLRGSPGQPIQSRPVAEPSSSLMTERRGGVASKEKLAQVRGGHSGRLARRNVVLWMTVYGPARRGAEHGDAPSRAFRTRPLPPSPVEGPCRASETARWPRRVADTALRGLPTLHGGEGRPPNRSTSKRASPWRESRCVWGVAALGSTRPSSSRALSKARPLRFTSPGRRGRVAYGSSRRMGSRRIWHPTPLIHCFRPTSETKATCSVETPEDEVIDFEGCSREEAEAKVHDFLAWAS